MGKVTSTVKDYIKSEYERLEKEQGFLNIDDARKLNCLEDMKINFNDIASLFMLDFDKDGRFCLLDLIKFAEWCGMVTDESHSKSGKKFETEVQIQSMVMLWKYLREEGVECFVEWVISLFEVVELEDHPDMTYLHIDDLQMIHEILKIKDMTGMDCQLFIDLLHKIAEEEKLQDLKDVELDDLIPLKITRAFLFNFSKGYVEMMSYFFLDVVEAEKKMEEDEGREEEEDTGEDTDSAKSYDENMDFLDIEDPKKLSPASSSVSGRSSDTESEAVNIGIENILTPLSPSHPDYSITKKVIESANRKKQKILLKNREKLERKKLRRKNKEENVEYTSSESESEDTTFGTNSSDSIVRKASLSPKSPIFDRRKESSSGGEYEKSSSNDSIEQDKLENQINFPKLTIQTTNIVYREEDDSGSSD